MSTAEHLDYSMLIEWSDEDQLYLVTLPEWAPSVMQPVTHGASYEEAARSGREALEMLIESAKEEGEPVPGPRTFYSTHTSAAGNRENAANLRIANLAKTAFVSAKALDRGRTARAIAAR